MERLKELFKCSIVARRIFGIPLLFLVFYYIVQVNYQLDDCMLHVMCPRALARPLAAAGNGTGTGKKTAEETCRDWMKMTFDENNKNYATITKLITFLLGFYVSRIINQWWNKVCYYLDFPTSNNKCVFPTQVRAVPKVENPGMVLSALTWEDANAKTEELTSPAAVAEAKKMVARYLT